MKKFFVRVMVMCVVMALACTAALAAFNNISVESEYTSSVTMNPDGDTVKLTGKDVPADSQVLILALSSEGVPTADNIIYIDQDASSENGVNFAIYPNVENLTAGSTYYVYLSSNAASGPVGTLKKVGSFVYTTASDTPTPTPTPATSSDTYAPGDVDNDQNVTAADAMLAMQIAVDMQKVVGTQSEEWTAAEKTAADVDKDSNVTASDAMYIMQRAVDLIANFDSLS